MLSAENHQWFNKQSKQDQRRYNDMFQEYKRTYNIAVATFTDKGITNAELIEIPEEIEDFIIIPVEPMTEEDIRRYEEYKQQRNKRIIDKFEEER